jgi:putative endopeptidase
MIFMRFKNGSPLRFLVSRRAGRLPSSEDSRTIARLWSQIGPFDFDLKADFPKETDVKKMIATLALVLAACAQEESVTGAPDIAAQGSPEVANADAYKRSGLLLEHMNVDVKPGDDFNAFVNGGWIDATEIPGDKPGYGIAVMLRDQAQQHVKTIIEQAAAGDFAEGSDEQKVGDLFASYMDMETRNRLGVSPLDIEFEKIDALGSYDDLAVYFAEANKIGIGTPILIDQYADFKDPTTYMIYAEQHGLGLPDREFYFQEDQKSKDIRDKYVQHIAKMFDLAGMENGAAAADMIIALETRLAAEHMKKEQTRDMVLIYNPVPLTELPELMPQFNWDGFIAEADIGNIENLVVLQLDYLRALDGIVRDTPLDDWKTWLKWSALNSYASYLDEALDDQNFEFYSKTLYGIQEQRPRWRRGVDVVNRHLGEAVGKVYVAEHFPPEAKAKMQELVGNLIKAYEVSIRELDWMGEETRTEALDKLSKFTPKIGYPDKWEDYSKLDIERDDLVGNIQRSSLRVYNKFMERQGGPVDRDEWRMTPQTVNAYYSPPLNEIVFPAAILQPPYFDLNAEDAVNYGGIGAIIGHEIGHGFDDKGSTFDGDGVLRNWWTDEDRKEFETRTARLVDQYSAFQPFPDLNVNGEFTLGENIGDLGGLNIALRAYRISLNGSEPPVMDGYTGWQRVFLGYAQSWRYKYRDEALRNKIMTDPHSPRMYRVNGVVRNVPEFYEAFQIADTDALYLPPEERVKIW